MSSSQHLSQRRTQLLANMLKSMATPLQLRVLVGQLFRDAGVNRNFLDNSLPSFNVAQMIKPEDAT